MPANAAAPRAILAEAHRFWFGTLSSPLDRAADRAPLWFRQSDDFDRAISNAFDTHLRSVAETDWDLAALSREEKVGLVVMLDQFPRNIFRNSGQAFAFDQAARGFARRLVAGGVEDFFHIERPFLFLPFEHSEEMTDQDHSLFLFAREAANGPESFREGARTMLDYAIKHWEIIRRFGRFPHRNAVLGRISTEPEIDFMREKGRGF
jgi:uncharacterized protein (DUF924 family)